MRFNEIVHVGCGGIFSYAHEFIARTCDQQAGAPKKATLIDGDKFEAKNMLRQDMRDCDIGVPKAERFRNLWRAKFSNLTVDSVTDYLGPVNAEKLLPDDAIWVVAVDNDPTRLLLSKLAAKRKNVAVIDGSQFGVGEAQPPTTGSAYLYLRLNGVDITNPLHVAYPKIAEVHGKTPGELTCQEREALPGGQQLGATNLMVAAWMGNFVATLVELGPDAGKLALWAKRNTEIIFDLNRCSATHYARTPDVPIPAVQR